MELKIVNAESKDYCESVGISPDRQQEMSKALDAMVSHLNSGPMQLRPIAEIFSEIASWCNNAAELVYCTTLHCAWHHRRGRILAPGPLNQDNITLGNEMLFDRLRKEFGCQHIIKKLQYGEEEVRKEGARDGVQHLLDKGEVDLAIDIMNRLTGYAF